MDCFRSFLPTVLLLFMLSGRVRSYYMKPYSKPPAPVPLPQPKPVRGTPRQPVVIERHSTQAGPPPKPPTKPADVAEGGSKGGLGRGTGWGVEFSIWIWVDVVPATEKIWQWYIPTTTPEPIILLKYYTSNPWETFNKLVKAYGDLKDYEDSWNSKSGGQAMRSVGGGTDPTDNSIIAFIVITVIVVAGVAGALYWRRKQAMALEEGEEDEDAKEEPQAADEGEGEEKPPEEAA